MVDLKQSTNSVSQNPASTQDSLQKPEVKPVISPEDSDVLDDQYAVVEHHEVVVEEAPDDPEKLISDGALRLDIQEKTGSALKLSFSTATTLILLTVTVLGAIFLTSRSYDIIADDNELAEEVNSIAIQDGFAEDDSETEEDTDSEEDAIFEPEL